MTERIAVSRLHLKDGTILRNQVLELEGGGSAPFLRFAGGAALYGMAGRRLLYRQGRR